jgi:hypothetical protein
MRLVVVVDQFEEVFTLCRGYGDQRMQSPDRHLPETGGLNYATTRNRTLAVGKRIEVPL